MIVEHQYKVDVNQPMIPRYLPEPLYYSDRYSDKFSVELVKGTAEYDPGNGRTVGYFVREETGETVVLYRTTLLDNVASVILDPACYAISGRCTIVIQIVSGTETKTVFLGHTKVIPTHTSEIVDPGHVVADVTELIREVQLLYEELVATQEDFSETYSEVEGIIADAADVINIADDKINTLADTSVHHYIQDSAPTENLRNGDFWTAKEIYAWNEFAEDYPTWGSVTETWGGIMSMGEAGETKIYFNGAWLVMANVSVQDFPTAETNQF